MMFSWPSPAPTLVAIAMSGSLLALDVVVGVEPPHADSASTAALATATAPRKLFRCINVILSMATCSRLRAAAGAAAAGNRRGDAVTYDFRGLTSRVWRATESHIH